MVYDLQRLARLVDLNEYNVVGLVEDIILNTDWTGADVMSDEVESRGVLCYNPLENMYLFLDTDTEITYYSTSTFRYTQDETDEVNNYFGWGGEPSTKEQLTHLDIWVSGVGQEFAHKGVTISKTLLRYIVGDSMKELFSTVLKPVGVTGDEDATKQHRYEDIKEELVMLLTRTIINNDGKVI